MTEIEPQLLFAIIGEQAVRLRLQDAEQTALRRRIDTLEQRLIDLGEPEAADAEQAVADWGLDR